MTYKRPIQRQNATFSVDHTNHSMSGSHNQQIMTTILKHQCVLLMGAYYHNKLYSRFDGRFAVNISWAPRIPRSEPIWLLSRKRANSYKKQTNCKSSCIHWLSEAITVSSRKQPIWLERLHQIARSTTRQRFRMAFRT